MKTFMEPEIIKVNFETEDVIATSGGGAGANEGGITGGGSGM